MLAAVCVLETYMDWWDQPQHGPTAQHRCWRGVVGTLPKARWTRTKGMWGPFCWVQPEAPPFLDMS